MHSLQMYTKVKQFMHISWKRGERASVFKTITHGAVRLGKRCTAIMFAMLPGMARLKPSGTFVGAGCDGDSDATVSIWHSTKPYGKEVMQVTPHAVAVMQCLNDALHVVGFGMVHIWQEKFWIIF